jgi:hypothetical protein
MTVQADSAKKSLLEALKISRDHLLVNDRCHKPNSGYRLAGPQPANHPG